MSEAEAWREVARRFIEWKHIAKDGLCYTSRLVVGAEDVVLWKAMLVRIYLHVPLIDGSAFKHAHAYMPIGSHPNRVRGDREAAKARAMAALWFAEDCEWEADCANRYVEASQTAGQSNVIRFDMIPQHLLPR